MYKEHPVAHTPPEQRIIWRYRSIGTKPNRENRLRTILNGELYFCRLDKLQDEYEGKLPEANFDTSYRKQRAEEVRKSLREQNKHKNYERGLLANHISGIKERVEEEIGEEIDREVVIEVYEDNFVEQAVEMIEEEAPQIGQMRKDIFANCWQRNDFESDIMWKSYGTEDTVAIKSTIGKFRKSIEKEETHDAYIGRVKYIDPQQEPIPEGYATTPSFYKWVQFKHEEEVRGVVVSSPPAEPIEGQPNAYGPKYDQQPPGIKINVEPKELITEIRVAPGADDEIYQKIIEQCKSYGISEDNVSHSVLADSYQSEKN